MSTAKQFGTTLMNQQTASPLESFINSIIKNNVYNSQTNRVLPSSPYWSMQNAGKQAATMKPNTQGYYDALTAPMDTMVMGATTGPSDRSGQSLIHPINFGPEPQPKPNDPLANSLNNYLNDSMGNSLRQHISEAAPKIEEALKLKRK